MYLTVWMSLVPEVVLQRPRVVAIVGELKTTGMAQHVWVDRERHLGSLADALDERIAERSPAFEVIVRERHGETHHHATMPLC